MRSLPLIAISFTIALCAQVGGVSAATSSLDRQFLRKAIQGDISEVRLGHLAESRGSSASVKRFGAVLARDHAAALASARRLARQIGIVPPAQPAAEALREYRKLQHLHGGQFDREFASYMVEDHRKDISDFKDEAKHCSSVGALAAQTLPALRKHLRLALALEHHH